MSEQQIPTIAQRLTTCRALIDAVATVSEQHGRIGSSGPMVWREVHSVVETVQHDLASLAKAMDATAFCRACWDSFAPPIDASAPEGAE
jgi:hypothetical protein